MRPPGRCIATRSDGGAPQNARRHHRRLDVRARDGEDNEAEEVEEGAEEPSEEEVNPPFEEVRLNDACPPRRLDAEEPAACLRTPLSTMQAFTGRGR